MSGHRLVDRLPRVEKVSTSSGFIYITYQAYASSRIRRHGKRSDEARGQTRRGEAVEPNSSAAKVEW